MLQTHEWDRGAITLPGKLRVEFPDHQKVCSYASEYSNPFWAAFESKAAKGAVVALVWDAQKLVYRSLATPGPTSAGVFGSFGVQIPSNSFYIEHCETDPTFRGQGIYTAMLHNLCYALKTEHGAEKILIGTDLENRASQRGIINAGFTPSQFTVVLLLCWKYGTLVLHEVNFEPDHFRP